jgi:hypothetical protein
VSTARADSSSADGKTARPPSSPLSTRGLLGRKVPLVGEKLEDVLGRLKRRVLDVEVELDDRKRSYGGKRSGASYRCRLVGVWNDETRKSTCT